ncbi:MAG: T9SS type A sorting domain-containing protein [Ignavibacteriaceae bacterium]|nr:T9SS type A sorting domain-containing protein [Ignavibacteriaceae bacterium]
MKNLFFAIAIVFLVNFIGVSQVSVTATAGTLGPTTYTNLRLAFAAINAGTHQGDITISITGNFTDNNTWALNASGSGSASYTSVSISPSGGAARTISGSYNGTLIDLNGAGNITIDGLNTDGNGLIISNTNTGTSASTIRFINGASSNTIRKCTIQGSGLGIYGIIDFSTSSGLTGNNNNTISSNNITRAGENRPNRVISSFGTSGKENTGNTISDNNIFNFLIHGAASFGIYLRSFTTAWTITGNSFYETASFVPTTANVTYYILNIDNTSGNNFTISDNFIGGSEPECSGSPWTKTNARDNVFYAIYLNLGTSTASNVQGNKISNISWANSSGAYWYGIYINSGRVDFGTSSGNIIGAQTGTGSITFTYGNASPYFYGIFLSSNSALVDCQNNTIASITTTSTSTNMGILFFAIYKSGSGTTTISNNTIGSTSTSNSINASNTAISSPQKVYGIISGGTGSLTFSNNTIANIRNATTHSTTTTTGVINGILITQGSNTVTNNTIHDLSISNANNYSTNEASAAGIVFNYTGGTQNISENVIYNISNTRADFAGTVTGLYYSGPTTASTVSRNFIHSLSVDASTTNASVYGIRINAGVTTYSNNIISLGGNTQTTLYGIYETGAASNNNNLYFNTVYLSGNPTAGASNSYALYSNASTNTRNFRNNILVNARSNGGSASGSHYTAWFNYAVNTNLTLDYNDYFVSGIGGVLGRYNSANVTSLPLITSNDANSKNVDPEFSSAGGTTAANYQTSNRTIIAVTETGTTIDYAGELRDLSYPTMGAFENAVPLPVELTSFTAKVVSKNVTLNWQTATEQNNHGFEVERSAVASQNMEWKTIGFVEGHGNSNSLRDYSFVDNSPLSGLIKYRLKQIDNDGKYSYSNEVEIEVANIPTDYVLFQNYPNPFNPSTTIKFGLPKDSKVVLEVYNIIGEKVTTLINQEMSAGYHNINFTATGLATGIYIYRLTANEFTSTKKFILMK